MLLDVLEESALDEIRDLIGRRTSTAPRTTPSSSIYAARPTARRCRARQRLRL